MEITSNGKVNVSEAEAIGLILAITGQEDIDMQKVTQIALEIVQEIKVVEEKDKMSALNVKLSAHGIQHSIVDRMMILSNIAVHQKK